MCLNMWQTPQFFLQMLLILSTYGGILATPMHTHIYTCISQKFRILALMRSENSTLLTTVVRFGKVSLDLTNSRSQLSLVEQLWVLQMGNSISLLQWLKALLFLHLSMPLRSIQMWKICCSRLTKMKVSFILEKTFYLPILFYVFSFWRVIDLLKYFQSIRHEFIWVHIQNSYRFPNNHHAYKIF